MGVSASRGTAFQHTTWGVSASRGARCFKGIRTEYSTHCILSEIIALYACSNFLIIFKLGKL